MEKKPEKLICRCDVFPMNWYVDYKEKVTFNITVRKSFSLYKPQSWDRIFFDFEKEFKMECSKDIGKMTKTIINRMKKTRPKQLDYIENKSMLVLGLRSDEHDTQKFCEKIKDIKIYQYDIDYRLDNEKSDYETIYHIILETLKEENLFSHWWEFWKGPSTWE